MSFWFPSGKISLDGVNHRLRSILDNKLVNDTHYSVLHRPYAYVQALGDCLVRESLLQKVLCPDAGVRKWFRRLIDHMTNEK